MKIKKHLTKLALIIVISCLTGYSCTEYLDIVPDNTPTINHAFNNRFEAEGFLYGCYSFIPNFANPVNNPALLGADEIWYTLNPNVIANTLWYIQRGDQSSTSPLADYFASNQTSYSLNGGKGIYTALRDCNIFLENIHLPYDLPDWERERWILEVKFLKAFYHFWLLRMYGPIPIVRDNLPVSASPEEVQKYRAPVDEVVDYIVELIDEIADKLPIEAENIMTDLGKPTKAIALALKAQTLTLAASPLFNGNPDYADIVDNRGIRLFPDYSAEKWNRAAIALREAINAAHEAGHKLYDWNTNPLAQNLSEQTNLAMQVRGAVMELWNPEIIWGDPRGNESRNLQRVCHPSFTSENNSNSYHNTWTPPLHIVEQFYTKNGVPIDEDPEWEGVDLLGLRVGDAEHKYNIKEGYTTANMHFNREARFYGSLWFHGNLLYGNGRVNSDNNQYLIQTMRGNFGASQTGYGCKKFVHYLSALPEKSNSLNAYSYPFPIIRLADLYLMYAEALNESKTAPANEVYEYIDLVRNRTGLKGVVESWQQFSKFPDKPSTTEGMRDIIQRERLNELAFEGARFWDLRRWKLAEEYMNKPVRILNNVRPETVEEFFQEVEVYQLTFDKKDYLWPIRTKVLLQNRNLIQNPGWN
ncbi:MAG: RagB/SusD family nutrient uptake outer membrane protein [Syntrophomonadaceae bacterium]|nr:RagB/SusD family nutrient uptake outer membrane protein [Syntrophomonadaceae bacterium]